MRNLYRWHRIMGLIIVLPVLVWIGSAVLHPLMRVTKPEIANPSLVADIIHVDEQTRPFSEAVALFTDHSVLGMHMITFDGRWFYQISLSEQQEPVYVDVLTLAQLPEGDKRYAMLLANRYLGSVRAVDAVRVDAFSAEYPAISRYLPVWKVQTESDLRLYIDTETGTMAAFVDDNRAQLSGWFSTLHTFAFLGEQSLLRIMLIMAILSMLMVMVLLGVRIWWSAKQRQVRRQSWHARLGIVLALFILAFSLSGGVHMLQKHNAQNAPILIPRQSFAKSDFGLPVHQVIERVAGKVVAVSLAKIAGQPYYRLSLAKKEPVYVHAQTGKPLEKADEAYAREMVKRVWPAAHAEEHQTSLITHYSSEYRFIDRRLPVVKVALQDDQQTTLYVDTFAAVLALVATPKDAQANAIFNTLHKWSWAQGIGLDVRDMIMVLLLALLAIVAILGVHRLWKK